MYALQSGIVVFKKTKYIKKVCRKCTFALTPEEHKVKTTELKCMGAWYWGCMQSIYTLARRGRAQVSVIPRAEYEIPEGCRVQPGSRSSLRKKAYPPRELLRAQAAGKMADFLKGATAAQFAAAQPVAAAAPSAEAAPSDGAAPSTEE